MLHTSGWGIDEVHGLAELDGEVQAYSSTQATVYSHCARFVIQRLLVERDDPDLVNLVWDTDLEDPEWVEKPDWTGDDLVNPAIFNKAVWEAGDGPGYYSAEINVKGKVIYGYTWSVRKLNDDGAGDYRITFYLDDTCPAVLNTYFTGGVTEIIQPSEEEIAAAAAAEGDDGESPGGGAVGVLDTVNNLTYIDVRILERGGGGGGGGSGGGGGGGGGHGH
jgi:hypothetical protein